MCEYVCIAVITAWECMMYIHAYHTFDPLKVTRGTKCLLEATKAEGSSQ